MKIFLTNQYKNRQKLLAEYAEIGIALYHEQDLSKKVNTIQVQSSKDFKDCDFSFLDSFSIFPSNIMIGFPQWKDEKRSMQIGDTIVQQVYLPPIKYLSQKLIFGVRIKEIINAENKRGFSYETLEGHVELGISKFSVEKKEDIDGIEFKIETISEPGNLISKLAGPIFSLPYQSYCAKQALRNMKEEFEKRNN